MTYSLSEFKKSKNRIEKQFNNIISSKGSIKKLVSDYPKIYEYLTYSFPSINVSDIPIFLTNRTAMSKNGFDNINGCFIPHLQKILVCKKCTTVTGKKNTKYLELLSKKIKTKIDHEDIVLHELLHAVSFRLNRYNKRYKNNEEEFVFLNSFEFYRNKGMSNENIINSILICFCINNITSNYKEMQQLFTQLKKEQDLDFVPWEKDYTEKEYNDFINEHADYLSDSIIHKARGEGKKILEIEQSRKKTSVSQDAFEFVLSSEKVRSLDLEID